MWFALIGAFLASMLVYAMGSVGGGKATPLTLTLAGVAISAVLGGFTSAIVLKNIDALNVTRFWGVGSIGGRSMEVVLTCLPLIVLGVLTVCVGGIYLAWLLVHEQVTKKGRQ